MESEDSLPKEAYIKAVNVPLITHWSKIRCGSYTAEWIARVVGVKPPSANSVLRGPVWFDVFRPVVPFDMRELFRFNGLTTIEVILNELTDREKIEWIKTQIVTTHRPPALLIQTKMLHWIAIAGYDDAKQIFYVYDSRFGKDSMNPELPIGNFTFTYEELLHRWRGRWWMRYVAILVTTVRTELPLI